MHQHYHYLLPSLPVVCCGGERGVLKERMTTNGERGGVNPISMLTL